MDLEREHRIRRCQDYERQLADLHRSNARLLIALFEKDAALKALLAAHEELQEAFLRAPLVLAPTDRRLAH